MTLEAGGVGYRRSAHAVTDLKYHVIWVTKYRYKILRGDIAERARELLRQICVAREVTIIWGAVSPDHIPYVGGGPAAVVAVETGAVPEGAIVALAPTGVSGVAEALLGAASCGRAGTTVRVSERWTNGRSGSISRISGGMRMSRASRLPPRPSLEPAGQPGRLQAASAAARRSVDQESTAFRR